MVYEQNSPLRANVAPTIIANISRYTWRCHVCSHQAGKYTNNIFNHPTLEILYVCVFTSACLGSLLLTSLYSIWKLNDFGGLCSDTRIDSLWPQTRMRWSIPVQRYCEYFPLKLIRLWIQLEKVIKCQDIWANR